MPAFGVEFGSVIACTCMIVVRGSHPKRRPPGATEQRSSARLVLALQLLGFQVTGPGNGLSWTEPGPRRVDFPTVVMPKIFADRSPQTLTEVNQVDLDHAVIVAQKIPAGCFEDPTDKKSVALHRFSLATAHLQDSEALIDYTVALEALLLPSDMEKTETGLRFRLTGARYLSSSPAERRAVHDALKRIYDARSNLVHGGQPKGVTRDPQALSELRLTARNLAAKGIVKALETHWPTAKEFEESLLS